MAWGASFTPSPANPRLHLRSPNPRLHLRSPLPTGLQSLHLPRLLAQPFGRWSRPSFALHPPQASEGMLSLPTEPTEPPTEPTNPPTEPTDAPTDPTDAPTDEPTYGNVMYGDANCDGKINVADAVAILQYIANQTKYPLTPEGLNNADVFYRGDGITGSDAISIQKMDAGVLTSLPESYQQ